jgi:hypothetical protein
LHAGACLTSILPWGMCGGQSSPFGADAPVDGWCCSTGFSCVRVNAFYHQCQPLTTAALVQAPAPAGTKATAPAGATKAPPPPAAKAAASEWG